VALLAEELVEEWLRRQGYFTIRGIKLGVHEIDLLAVRQHKGSKVECRHVEVQASMRPVSFISRVPKDIQKSGRAANSAKRTSEELTRGVKEWVHTKFERPDKVALMQSLWHSTWSRELVLNVVKSSAEVALIAKCGVSVLWLKDIVASLATGPFPISSASGADFVDLIHMSTDAQPFAPADVLRPAASARG
jgi:hypothetical protein